MYTTPAGSRGGNPNVSGHSVIYESRDPALGRWEPINDFGFGDLGNKGIFEMAALGDHLYAGTFNLDGYQVWRTTAEGNSLITGKIIERGAYRGPFNQCPEHVPVQGRSYVGSGIQGGVDREQPLAAAELIRIHPDGTWDLIVGEARDTPDGRKEPMSGYLAGFDNFFNGYFWRMCEHNGWLYLSSFGWSFALGYARRETWPRAFTNIVNKVGEQFILERQSGFDLYRSFDGDNWVPVTQNGMDNPYNIGLRTMASSPHGLFLGTANPFGPKVLPLDGDGYVHNPRGGCEVFFAPSQKKID
jgi:hypothetical protein